MTMHKDNKQGVEKSVIPVLYKQKHIKDSNLSVRLSKREKDILQREAKAHGQTLSEYVKSKIFASSAVSENSIRDTALARVLYEKREQVNDTFGVSPEVDQAIHETVQCFLRNGGRYS
jgi:uncharacterized protein (DUF1778 family)